MATPEPINHEAVLGLFKRVWPKVKPYPGYAARNTIAICLCNLRERKKGFAKTLEIKREMKLAALKTAVSARAFRDSTGMRSLLQMELSTYYSTEIKDDGTEERTFYDRNRFDRCENALAALRDAQRSVQVALDAWELRDPLIMEDADAAMRLAKEVRNAWASVGQEAPSSGLAKFIRSALALIGQTHELSAIHKVLSGEHGRLRT